MDLEKHCKWRLSYECCHLNPASEQLASIVLPIIIIPVDHHVVNTLFVRLVLTYSASDCDSEFSRPW